MNEGRQRALDSAWEIQQRRSILRGLLSHGPRFTNLDEIMTAAVSLGANYSASSRGAVARDLNAIGARAERDSQGDYWTVGAPFSSPLTYAPDEELHLSELQRVLRSDVLEARALGPFVTFRCAPASGKKVEWWLAMLEWREIVSVIGSDHWVQITCVGVEQAKFVLTRLYGRPLEGKPAPDRIDQLMFTAGVEDWWGNYSTLQDKLAEIERGEGITERWDFDDDVTDD